MFIDRVVHAPDALDQRLDVQMLLCTERKNSNLRALHVSQQLLVVVSAHGEVHLVGHHHVRLVCQFLLIRVQLSFESFVLRNGVCVRGVQHVHEASALLHVTQEREAKSPVTGGPLDQAWYVGYCGWLDVSVGGWTLQWVAGRFSGLPMEVQTIICSMNVLNDGDRLRQEEEVNTDISDVS